MKTSWRKRRQEDGAYIGRAEPCVLFCQTFVHSQLDEYIDEVLFSEPVVITSCEFIEHSGSSVSSAVSLVGATSPSSFALEIFVQCEGEIRFKRLCQPFLYSPSSSNVLEVEVAVCNYVVVRGSYRSLTLVIYGNTAEDLGQFNIDMDLDNTLTNKVSSVEGIPEDLPLALCSTYKPIEEIVCPPKALSLEFIPADIDVEVKRLLQLVFKILQLSHIGDQIDKVISCLVTVASSSSHRVSTIGVSVGSCKNFGNIPLSILVESRKEVEEIFKNLQYDSDDSITESSVDLTFLDSTSEILTSKELVDLINSNFNFEGTFGLAAHPQLPKNKSLLLWLSAAFFICSSRESCFHFVNSGGMKQLENVFLQGLLNSRAVKLTFLVVIEQATRFPIGCEDFLGWWPRDGLNVPSGTSEGYNMLLKLLLDKQPHDIASLATCILQRLRIYEVASRYESAVLIVLGSDPSSENYGSAVLDKLVEAKIQLKKLVRLLKLCGPIQDPSLVASTCRSLNLWGSDGLLSYKSTINLISSLSCSFSSEIDLYLLSLLKERGFFSLSAAVLSSPNLRDVVGHATDVFLDVTSCVGAIMISLVSCRSGLLFLLSHPELSITLILSLKGRGHFGKEDPFPFRYASVLISKGIYCHPDEVGKIIETHLRVVNAVDRLLLCNPQSDETLWVLWELCSISRSICGRQALLVMGLFPEVISVLVKALHSIKEVDLVPSNCGTSSLNFPMFHSAAEVLEIIVSDSLVSSMSSWIGHATELHKALDSSSPGSNRKDVPTRLLEWLDASVVYRSKGATRLLHYAVILVSGGEGHIALTSILSSDVIGVENEVEDSSSNSENNLIGNLRKSIYEKSYQPNILRESSVAQLTTAFRILAFISENSVVAASLYEEGAVLVVHALLINSGLILEKSFNNYDHLVDEGTETSADLLLDRNREQSLVDLLIPSLVLLFNLLQSLQGSKEQNRNAKLMKALVHLHREVSSKLAACSADLASYPVSALGYEAVCHLIVTVLVCWPIYGWTPNLFSFLVDSLHTTTLLALGPKEACSFFCLLNDLLPEEGIWLWKEGIPMLSGLRMLAVGTFLGHEKEKHTEWYLQPKYLETLLSELVPQLENIAQIVLHCAITTSVVLQDMLRVCVIRIACLNMDHASILLEPIVSSIRNCLSNPSITSSMSDIDTYKISRLLDFLSVLSEHPCGKALLLKEAAVHMLVKVLEISVPIAEFEGKPFFESRNIDMYGFPQLSWCVPALRTLKLLCDSRPYTRYIGRIKSKTLTMEDCSLILSLLLELCKVLRVGRELLACLSVFKETCLAVEGQQALLSITNNVKALFSKESDSMSIDEDPSHINAFDTLNWKKYPPLLCCWINLLRSLDSRDVLPDHVIDAVTALSYGVLKFCMDGKRWDLDRVVVLKNLFGIPHDASTANYFLEENIKYIQDLASLLTSKMNNGNYQAESSEKKSLYQATQFVKSLLFLLGESSDLIMAADVDLSLMSSVDVEISPKICMIAESSDLKIDDQNLSGLVDKYFWECPESLRERLSEAALPQKRKTASDVASRRLRGDNSFSETQVQNNAFSRGPGQPAVPTRRDSFRQRKPNTSRPPSMHVDDYVARERSIDGGSSNVIAVQRVGSTSGRPPSIHVDEFMARQRERQNPVGMASVDATGRLKSIAPPIDTDKDKSNKSTNLKTDLDDGIDIIFDAEEAEFDDKLPFPQPDDNLLQPVTVLVEQQRSPHSILDETGNDLNGSNGCLLAEENIQSDFSSMMSVSQPDKPLVREQSVSSDRKYYEQNDDPQNIHLKNNMLPSSRMSLHLQPKNNFGGPYDTKVNPPLPPMPPPHTMTSLISQASDGINTQTSQFVNPAVDFHSTGGPQGYHGHSQGVSSRAPPSLPPTSLPYPMSNSNLPSHKTSIPLSTAFNQSSNTGSVDLSHPSLSDHRFGTHSAPGATITSYPPSPLQFSRPVSMPPMGGGGAYGSNATPPTHTQGGDNLSGIPQHNHLHIQSMQTLSQLHPLQPPQILRPPHHLRPPMQVVQQQSEQLQQQGTLPSSLHSNKIPSQITQQSQIPPIPLYYQQQQESLSLLHAQQRHQVDPPQMQQQQQVIIQNNQGGESSSSLQQQQQQDAAMTLQHYFSSPEAIQSLLNDRDKLCQLLEQHPKLMQMLQERLGQI